MQACWLGADDDIAAANRDLQIGPEPATGRPVGVDIQHLVPGLDTVGWFATAGGGRRLIVYTVHGSSQLRPEMLVFGPVIRADRIGLDTARAASLSGAHPTYVLVQRATWDDSADPTGLAHMPWAAPGVAGFFAVCAAGFYMKLAMMRRRHRSLRTRIAGLLQCQSAPLAP